MTKYISQPLVIVGALNWGLIGAFDFNLKYDLKLNRYVVSVFVSIKLD